MFCFNIECDYVGIKRILKNLWEICLEISRYKGFLLFFMEPNRNWVYYKFGENSQKFKNIPLEEKKSF